MAREDEGFIALWGLIGAYFHQDLYLSGSGSVPEAISEYAHEAEDSHKAELMRDMDDFARRYHNDAEAEFARRWGFHFTPDMLDQTVPEFFDMVRAILADPTCYPRFE